MTIEVETWTAPVVKLNAVFLTNSNIEEVARWMQADFTQVMTDLHTLVRVVTFYLVQADRPGVPGSTITRAAVGQYIARKDAHINEYGDNVRDEYYPLTEEEMQSFRKEPDKKE